MSAEESSSSSSSSSTEVKPSNAKPLFTSDPVEYVKVTTDPTEEEGSHIFIFDKDATKRYCNQIKDLLNIASEMNIHLGDGSSSSSSSAPSCSSSETTLVDDQPSESSSSVFKPVVEEHPIEFRMIPKQVMDVIIAFVYWKKRWAEVVTERIPDFPLPEDKNLALQALVAANDLGC